MDSALTTTLKSLHNVFLSIWVLSPLQKIYTQVSFHSQLYHESVPSSQALLSFWANPKNININIIRIHKTLCFRNFVPKEIIHRQKKKKNQSNTEQHSSRDKRWCVYLSYHQPLETPRVCSHLSLQQQSLQAACRSALGMRGGYSQNS